MIGFMSRSAKEHGTSSLIHPRNSSSPILGSTGCYYLLFLLIFDRKSGKKFFFEMKEKLQETKIKTKLVENY